MYGSGLSDATQPPHASATAAVSPARSFSDHAMTNPNAKPSIADATTPVTDAPTEMAVWDKVPDARSKSNGDHSEKRGKLGARVGDKITRLLLAIKQQKGRGTRVPSQARATGPYLAMLQAATFVPVRKVDATGLLPQGDDGFLKGEKMLFPSPASGRGSRLFLGVHVGVHLLSLVFTLVYAVNVFDTISSDAADTLATFSLITFILGVIAILLISGMSKNPFSQHGLILSLSIWGFLASFATLIASVVFAYSNKPADHEVPTWGLLAILSQSWGLSIIMAAFVTGVSVKVETSS